MHKRISTLLQRGGLSGNHFYHSTFKQSSHHFPCYAEEVLASHIAPLLQQQQEQRKNPSSPPSILQQTQQIHAQVTVNGLHSLGTLGSRIVGMYLMCSNYSDANRLFCQLQLSYAAPWNWMIRGFTVMGYYDYAVLFYFKMLGFGASPDKYTFPCLIKACGGLNAVGLVRDVHGMVNDLGFELDVYVGSALVKFYAENDCLECARKLFDKLPHRDTVLWNVMLGGYSKHEDLADVVVELFEEMRRSGSEVNSVTYTSVLCLCGSKSMVGLGAQIHGLVVRCGLEMDPPVANTLVAMYAKCRSFFDARKLFDCVTRADLITWNGIIGGYVQNGFMIEALDLFQRMISSGVKPDSRTFTSLLPSVQELGCFDIGKEIHCYIVRHEFKLDVFLKNSLIDMYFKFKDVKMARRLFDENSAVDIVICSAMISGYVLNGMNTEALKIFRWLLDMKMRPNAVTLASILPACAGLAALKLGKELHGSIIRKGLEGRCYVGSAITDMYAKCGRLDLGHQAFQMMTERDSVSWNSMITNYCQNGRPELAMDLFHRMGMEGAKYDCVSISAALSACANMSALHHGREIHGFMMRGGFNFDLFSSSALIDMYAKCGALDLAQKNFDTVESRNEVSWNSIIAAYGNHGQLGPCLVLFNEMKDEGFEPDHVTFLAIISACGHTGLVEEGKYYFKSMIEDYGITPTGEHYACLIDLLGRAGRLEEAFQVLKEMPFTPDAGIWGTLLGACRLHGNVELAEVASGYVFQLDPQNSGYYVLLSNLHADSGKRERVNQIRGIMKERKVQKVPGYSWIEVDKSSHMFAAADKCHPESYQIYLLLNSLIVELQNAGYDPQLDPSFHPLIHAA